MVSNWEPAHSLVEDDISGAEIAPCLPALAVACLSFCLHWGQGPVHSWLAFLWHWLNPLFYEWARLHLSLELFTGKFSLSLSLFFFLSLSLAILQFGLLSHVSSLRLFSGHSGPVLTLSNAARASLFSPCLLVADVSFWATPLLGVTVRPIFCGCFSFFSSVMLPSEIPKLPQMRQ